MIARYLNKRDALSLAKTSKELVGPCLDIVWKRLKYIRPLINLFPTDIIEHQVDDIAVRVFVYLSIIIIYRPTRKRFFAAGHLQR